MMKPLSETEKAYLAGIIDGEGSVMIRQRGKRVFFLIVVVDNTNQTCIDYCKRVTGMGSAQLSRDIGGNTKRQYRWLVSSRHAEELLEAIYPYSIIKRPQIEVALEFRKTYRPTARKQSPLTRQEIRARELLRKKMKRLNRRGRV